jgi:hypothetical protein
MNTPIVNIENNGIYKITLFRGGGKEFHCFKQEVLVRRTDEDFPVEGEPDEDGYLYFIQGVDAEGVQNYVYVTPGEADLIVADIFTETGKEVGDY